eukprot:768080-Hanusia_phi.AAC.1
MAYYAAAGCEMFSLFLQLYLKKSTRTSFISLEGEQEDSSSVRSSEESIDGYWVNNDGFDLLGGGSWFPGILNPDLNNKPESS